MKGIHADIGPEFFVLVEVVLCSVLSVGYWKHSSVTCTAVYLSVFILLQLHLWHLFHSRLISVLLRVNDDGDRDF